MVEQYHTASRRDRLDQRRNDGQPATVPPTIPSTGFWVPSQATPSIGPIPQGQNASYYPQVNYPTIPNSQYACPNFNPNPSNPHNTQQLLPPGQGEITPPMLHVPDPPLNLTQEEWDALSASERAHVREAQETQAALVASVEDQIRIEAIAKSYSSRPLMFQAGHRSNDTRVRLVHGQGQHGYRPEYAHQPVPRPPASSDVMCALCGVREAVCQHPGVAGGVRTCEACFDEMHMAEQRRSS